MSDRDIDQQLVERAQRGEKRAFDLLVSKYQRRLARLLSRFVRDSHDIEDVTQEAFVKAYRALSSFRGESAFYTWLYRIGINTAKNFLSANGRRPVMQMEVEDEDGETFDVTSQLPDYHTPETELMNKEILATVNAAVERLPEADWLNLSLTVRQPSGYCPRIKVIERSFQVVYVCQFENPSPGQIRRPLQRSVGARSIVSGNLPGVLG